MAAQVTSAAVGGGRSVQRRGCLSPRTLSGCEIVDVGSRVLVRNRDQTRALALHGGPRGALQPRHDAVQSKRNRVARLVSRGYSYSRRERYRRRRGVGDARVDRGRRVPARRLPSRDDGPRGGFRRGAVRLDRRAVAEQEPHERPRARLRLQQVRGARELRRLDGAVDARRGFLAELEGSLPARLLERPRGFSSGDLARSHGG